MEISSAPVALITGAARRIGAALAHTFHEQGYNIVIHYSSSKSAAASLSQDLNTKRNNSALTIQANLNDEKEINQLIEQTKTQWNRVDLLINNASLFQPDENDINSSQWDELINTNSKANYLIATGLKNELAVDQGCIINLVDIYANRPLKNHTIYSVSKAACMMLTKSLALEFAPEIRVNGISPGAILWPEHETCEQHKQDLLQKIPLKRIGSLRSITETANYLASCDYLTGQVIAVDGGRSITI